MDWIQHKLEVDDTRGLCQSVTGIGTLIRGSDKAHFVKHGKTTSREIDPVPKIKDRNYISTAGE